MAGKSYIKTGGQWVLLKGMYIKTAGFWTTAQKAYIKVAGVWTKMFDSASTAPSISGTNPRIRLHSYSSTGFENVGSKIQMGPGPDLTPAETIADGETVTSYLWGQDGVWVNDAGAAVTRNFYQNTTNDTNTWSIDGNAEASGDKYANTANKIWWADNCYVWYSLSKTLNNRTGVGKSSALFITKQPPAITSGYIDTWNSVNAGVAKKAVFEFPFRWYNEIDMYSTYIEWFASSDTANTSEGSVILNDANRVRGPIYMSNKTYTLSDNGIYSDGSTARPGTSGWHQAYRFTDNTRLYGSDVYTPTASDVGKRLWIRITYANSYSVKNAQTLQDFDYSGIVADAPPVGSGTPTFVRDETSYGYRINGVGTWTGTPTSYRYAWYYRLSSQFGSSYALCSGTNATGTFTPAQLTAGTNPVFDATSFKPTNNTTGISSILAIVWATNSNGESASGYSLYDYGTAKEESKGSISTAITVPRYKKPVISTFAVTGGETKVTYDASWTVDDPAATATLSWTGQATGSITPSNSATGVSIPNLSPGTYEFTLTITNTGANAIVGSATSVKSNIIVTAVSTYTFTFGNTLYASTNGYVSFDDTNKVASILSTTGRVLGIYPRDLVQGYDATLNGQYYMLYWSNDSEYVIQWTGYQYGYTSDSANGLDTTRQLRYQVRFYKDQSYADIKYLIKGSNLTPLYNPAIYFDGSAINNQYTGSVAQGSSFRIYFNGNPPVTLTSLGLTFTEIAQQDMLDSGALTASSNVNTPSDDAYKTLVTEVNKFTAPTLTITTASVTTAATQISIPFTTGGAYNNYSIDVKTGGSSISGYPKTLQTAKPALITTVAETAYAITITPYNASGNAGTLSTLSKTTPAGLGDFTYYSYNATTIPTKPTLTFTQSAAAVENNNATYWSWATTKPADTASYITHRWGPAFTTDSTAAGSSESNPLIGSVITTVNQYSYNSSTTYEEYFGALYSGTYNGKVIATGSGTITAGVTWTASTGAGSYKVNYTISGQTTGNGTFTSASQTTTTFTKTMTAGGTLAVNNVTAYTSTDGTGTNTKNATLESGKSSSIAPVQQTVASDTATLSVTALPYAPTDFTLTAGSGKVDLSWTKPTSGTTVSSVLQPGGEATGYEWGYNTTNTESTATWTAVTSTTASKTGLTNGTTYYFWVRATNAAGYSASNSGSKAPAAQLGAFTINSPTRTNGSASGTITLADPTWTWVPKQVDFSYSSTTAPTAAKYLTVAYGTAYNPDTTSTASPSKSNTRTSTSDYWSFDEAGTVTIGVAGTTAVGKATVTWGASTDAGSYKVSYTLGGTAYTSAATTGTSFSVDTVQEFIVTGVTAYTTTDGTGTTTKAGTLPTTANITPTETYSGFTTKSVTVAKPFVAPYWNGTLPTFTSSNFTRFSYANPTTGRRLTSNVAYVYHAYASDDYKVNDSVTIAGLPTAFNGTYNISSVGSDTNGTYIAYAKTATNSAYANNTNGTITNSTSGVKWGWNNGTFSFAGDVDTSKGWNYQIKKLTTSGADWVNSYEPYSSVNDTGSIGTTSYRYIIETPTDFGPSTPSRLARLNPYQFGTDSVEYNVDVNGTRVWTGYV